MNQKRIPHMIEREKKYIEALEGKDLSCHGHWDMGYHQGRLSVLEDMEDMPGPWIPVAERPPEENMPVYATVEYHSGEREVREGIFKDNDFQSVQGHSLNKIIKAWQPRWIPLPYDSVDFH